MAAVAFTHGVHYSAASDLPDLANGRWGVFGLGVTGRAAATLFAAHGAQLVLVDENPAAKAALAPLFAEAEFRCGPVVQDALMGCQAVLVSPGIRPDHPALAWAHRNAIKLCGEAELLALLAPDASLVAITGTNGKSTTTALCGALLAGARVPTFVGGNIGVPIAHWLFSGVANEVGVLELSSALIDGMKSVAPNVATVLNVAPDHLDRYGSLAAYTASKARLVEAVPEGGIVVLNADDSATRAMAPLARGKVWWFAIDAAPPGDGVWLTGRDTLVGHGALTGTWPEVPLAHARLLGTHNRQNAMAALLCASAVLRPAPLPLDAMMAAYQTFAGLPHRLELVGTLDGARWLNDSKATNDASAATAVRAVAGPTLLLLGGRDKGGGYVELCKALRERRPKAAIAFGEARHTVAEALRNAGQAVMVVDHMADACATARALVAVGDAVLLSPACSSFDAFRNYLERGEAFAQWVRRAQAEAASDEGG